MDISQPKIKRIILIVYCMYISSTINKSIHDLKLVWTTYVYHISFQSTQMGTYKHQVMYMFLLHKMVHIQLEGAGEITNETLQIYKVSMRVWAKSMLPIYIVMCVYNYM